MKEVYLMHTAEQQNLGSSVTLACGHMVASAKVTRINEFRRVSLASCLWPTIQSTSSIISSSFSSMENSSAKSAKKTDKFHPKDISRIIKQCNWCLKEEKSADKFKACGKCKYVLYLTCL